MGKKLLDRQQLDYLFSLLKKFGFVQHYNSSYVNLGPHLCVMTVYEPEGYSLLFIDRDDKFNLIYLSFEEFLDRCSSELKECLLFDLNLFV